MLERAAVLLALGALVALAVVAVRAWNGRRLRHLLGASNPAPFWDSLGEAPDGRPTLVTFSTPSCAACRSAQAPAVSAVEQQFGAARVRVIRVDAALRPDVARVFGVQTVPSTVVLAPAGRVVAVNQGFAPSRRLVEQLQRS
jgi:thioredoxin-like negative regulator of GroEL